ncbi:MAG: spondin domain-containing protein [Solirubrobacterales bacterium]
MRPIRRILIASALVGVGALVLSSAAHAGTRDYEVTLKDLTSGQPLTPPVAATHRGKHAIFEVGQPASVGVREIAENGNNAPLLAFLNANPFGNVFDVTQGGNGPLVPDGTPGSASFDDEVSFGLEGSSRANRLSLASMLICTNDGFTGVDSLRLPNRVGRATVARTNGYDAHTEVNTEDYADIVPPCQGLIGDSSGEPGTDVSNPDLAEGGVIAHHDGIAGGSDLKPDLHGWTDPVARIVVERIG